MNKKTLLGLIGIIFILLASLSFIFVQQSQKTVTTTSRADDDTLLPTAKVQSPESLKKSSFSSSYKEYTDPSGYKFLYPSDLNVVVERNDSDPSFYSSVKLKSDTAAGYISVKAIQSNFETLSAWSAANNMTTRSVKVIKLADMEAYQAAIDGQLVTVALDSGGVMFTIISNTEKNSSLWRPVYDKLIASFSFAEPVGEDPQPVSEEASTEPDAVDSEEVIE